MLSRLARIHKKNQRGKTKTYQTILEKCQNQIINMANRDHTFCFYMVPLYVMGLPLYDINACIVYILLNLKKKGFQVQMANAQTIYISWKHIHQRQTRPQQRQIQQSSSASNNWSHKNQRYLPQRPAITYRPPNQINRFIEKSKRLL